jgi:pimeloyl-ACP methyl ester carboxylesterase
MSSRRITGGIMTDLLLPATPIVERRVRTGDITLNVAFAGSEDAPTMILLHGISSRLNTWHPVVDALAADYRLVIWEARGHGDSDHPAAGYLLGNCAADLSALLAALEIERPAIMGHSLGGMIAMTWAVDHPATARAIVLEDAPLRGGAEHVGRLEEWRRIAAMTVDEAAAHYRAEDPAQSEEEVHRRARSITATAEAVFTELRDEAGPTRVHRPGRPARADHVADPADPRGHGERRSGLPRGYRALCPGRPGLRDGPHSRRLPRPAPRVHGGVPPVDASVPGPPSVTLRAGASTEVRGPDGSTRQARS